MMATVRIFLLSGCCFGVLQSAGVLNNFATDSQKNNAPAVRVALLAPASKLKWNTQVSFEVTVSDKEDGESRFGEIPSAELFTELRYFPDSAKAAAYLRQGVARETTGLLTLKRQDCFNCHSMKAKVIGPSFQEVANRYKKSLDLPQLTSHVIRGSSGVWGTSAMPPHPDLAEAEARQIISWILDNAGDQNTDYLRGTDGSFWLRPSSNAKPTGVFTLKTVYTDHGINNDPASAMTGQHGVLVSGIQ